MVKTDVNVSGLLKHFQPFYVEGAFFFIEGQVFFSEFSLARTKPGHMGVTVKGDAVGSEYTPRFEFRGGEIIKVVYDVEDDGYIDVERTMAAAMARD